MNKVTEVEITLKKGVFVFQGIKVDIIEEDGVLALAAHSETDFYAIKEIYKSMRARE